LTGSERICHKHIESCPQFAAEFPFGYLHQYHEYNSDNCCQFERINSLVRFYLIVSRYFAFLRAINVGGHTVKMDALRQIFESLGFAGVETFIASGNVTFEAGLQDAVALENTIENRLREALGYEVSTFIRTDPELAAIAHYQPFQQSDPDAAATLNIAFLAAPLDPVSRQKLMALRTEIDDFNVHRCEIYWLCRKKQSESTFSNAVLEKALGRKATLRGVSTVKKMAENYLHPE